MGVNVRRGFNRLFIVVTGGWVIFCLFVYPIQHRHRAARLYTATLDDCYQNELGKGQEFRDCLQYAQLISGVGDWSLKSYYSRESWFLGLVILGGPIGMYAACRGIGALSKWVWRGFFGFHENG